MIGEIRQNFTEASASVGLILATALKSFIILRSGEGFNLLSLSKMNVSTFLMKKSKNKPFPGVWFLNDMRKNFTSISSSYTCQLFLRCKREIFILGVLGFLKTTRSFPKIPKEVRNLPKMSEVFRRRPKSAKGEVIESQS